MTSVQGHDDKAPVSWFLIKAIVSASLGGILFGYDLGVVSGALPQLKRTFSLSDTQQEMVVSFLYLGCCIGSTLGGALCDFAGRKRAILLTDVVFVIGAAVLYQSSTIAQLLIGRVLVGVSVAVSGIADVAYLHEISPPDRRGSIISVNEGCISLGFMLSYLAGYGISMIYPSDGWRLMFGMGAIIAILQLLCISFMPESPVWLEGKGHFIAAEKARTIIEGKHMVPLSGETTELTHEQESNNVDQEQKYGSMQHSNPQPVVSLCTFVVTYRKQILVTLFLAIMQEFCGHPNVLNFAPEIFAQIGYASSKSSLLGTFLVGLVKFIATCIVIVNIERVGRRKLLIFGISLICMGNLLLSLSLMRNRLDISTAFEQSIAVLGIFAVAIGYAVSFGPLTWLIVSEMFPAWIRGRALGASLFVTYIALFLVSFTFLSAQRLGKAIPFLCYFILTLLSIIFVITAIPDTGSKTPEEIELTMNEMPFWRKSSREPLTLFNTVSTSIV